MHFCFAHLRGLPISRRKKFAWDFCQRCLSYWGNPLSPLSTCWRRKESGGATKVWMKRSIITRYHTPLPYEEEKRCQSRLKKTKKSNLGTVRASKRYHALVESLVWDREVAFPNRMDADPNISSTESNTSSMFWCFPQRKTSKAMSKESSMLFDQVFRKTKSFLALI